MMEGVVVKVGQDKTSGKYVTLRHGNYTVSYCHLSRVLAAKGTVVRPAMPSVLPARPDEVQASTCTSPAS